MRTQASIAGLLDELAATLQQTAAAVRRAHDPEVELPRTLTTRNIAALEGWSVTTVWRRAKLGELGPTISGPGEKLRFDRDVYLEHRRRRHKRAAEAQAAEG